MFKYNDLKTYKYDKNDNILYVNLFYMFPDYEFCNHTRTNGKKYSQMNMREMVSYADHSEELLKEIDKYNPKQLCLISNWDKEMK